MMMYESLPLGTDFGSITAAELKRVSENRRGLAPWGSLRDDEGKSG